MNLDSIRMILVKRASLLIFCSITFATLTRPVFAELPMVLTYIGVANSFFAGIIALLLYYTKPRSYYPFLVIGSVFVFLTPLLLINGGVHSQFAVIIPVIPVFACLLGNARIGFWVGMVLLAIIISLYLWEDALPVYTEFSYSQDVAKARTFWLCMATMVSAYFGFQFAHMSRKLGKKLQYQATYDPLTKVMNRGSILEYLDDLLLDKQQSKSWISVLMIDLDNFKQINDQYGHQFGDACLAAVANGIKHSIRHGVDGMGRYGGEEFIVVLNDVDQSNTHKVAEKIRQAIEQLSERCLGQTVPLSVTVGYCCLLSDEVPDAHAMIKLADDALYVGKQQGKNSVVGAEEGKLVSQRLNRPLVPSEGEAL